MRAKIDKIGFGLYLYCRNKKFILSSHYERDGGNKISYRDAKLL